jgi:hypothetical protein
MKEKKQKPTKGMKNGKMTKRGRKAQNQSKSSKSKQKFMFLLSSTRLARVLPTLCPYSPPLAMNSSNTK